jgi:hypothetical protein
MVAGNRSSHAAVNALRVSTCGPFSGVHQWPPRRQPRALVILQRKANARFLLQIPILKRSPISHTSDYTTRPVFRRGAVV